MTRYLLRGVCDNGELSVTVLLGPDLRSFWEQVADLARIAGEGRAAAGLGPITWTVTPTTEEKP